MGSRPHLSPRVLPFTSVTHFYMVYYSFYQPWKDERLSQPSWLAYSRQVYLQNGHRSSCKPSVGQQKFTGQDRHSTHCVTQPTCQADWLAIPCLQRDAMHKCGLCRHVVSVCFCLSVHHVRDHVKKNKRIFKIYHHRVNPSL